jgi:hypothetical protein
MARNTDCLFLLEAHEKYVLKQEHSPPNKTSKVKIGNNNAQVIIFKWLRTRSNRSYYFPKLHDTNESIDPHTRPTIFAMTNALDESHLSHHLGTKALVWGATNLGGDAFNNFLQWGITTTWANCYCLTVSAIVLEDTKDTGRCANETCCATCWWWKQVRYVCQS